MTGRPNDSWFARLNALIRRAEDLITEVQTVLDQQVAAVAAELGQVDSTVAGMTQQLADMQAQIEALQAAQPAPSS